MSDEQASLRIVLSIGQCASLACLLEVSAPKPGNVHRGADFEDMTYVDFVISAVAIAPAMEHACRRGVGRTVRAAIQATRTLVRNEHEPGNRACCWRRWPPCRATSRSGQVSSRSWRTLTAR